MNTQTAIAATATATATQEVGMLKIIYSINGAASRECKIPSYEAARATRPAMRSLLEHFVADFGENLGAERYLKECFTTTNCKAVIVQY